MALLTFIGAVLVAAAADVLSIRWHDARERRQVRRAVALGVALEVANAVPVAAAVALSDWRLLAAGVIGSVIGTAWGLRAPAAS